MSPPRNLHRCLGRVSMSLQFQYLILSAHRVAVLRDRRIRRFSFLFKPSGRSPPQASRRTRALSRLSAACKASEIRRTRSDPVLSTLCSKAVRVSANALFSMWSCTYRCPSSSPCSVGCTASRSTDPHRSSTVCHLSSTSCGSSGLKLMYRSTSLASSRTL